MAHQGHPTSSPASLDRLELAIEGMTCASCAARVERSLNGLDGVDASVNLATGTAAVAFDPARADPARLVEAVERAGYRAARRPRPAMRSAGSGARAGGWRSRPRSPCRCCWSR